MTFNESGSDHQAPNDAATFEHERHNLASQTRKELSDLGQDVASTSPAIPKIAMSYLKSACNSPNHLRLAIIEAQLLLETAPRLLDDPVIVELLLPECVEKAKLSEINEKIATEKDANENKRAAIGVLKNDIAEAAKGKNGLAQLEAAQTALAKMNIDAEIKTEIQAWLNEIRGTADQITALANTPEEQVEIQRLFASTSFDLTAASTAVAFGDFISEAEASNILSEECKSLIASKIGITRLPEPKTGGQLLSKLNSVRINDGRFINTKGKVMEFNVDNGVDVGAFTVFPHPNDAKNYIAKAYVGGRELRLPFSPDTSPDFLTRQLRTAMVGYALANKDFQAAAKDVLGGSYLAAQGVSEINLASETEVQRAEHVLEAFLGTGSLYAGRLPTPQDMEVLAWRLQATHIDGDAKTNDNTGRGDESWEQLGLIAPDGLIDYSQLSAIGMQIRTASTVPTFANLKASFGVTV